MKQACLALRHIGDASFWAVSVWSISWWTLIINWRLWVRNPGNCNWLASIQTLGLILKPDTEVLFSIWKWWGRRFPCTLQVEKAFSLTWFRSASPQIHPKVLLTDHVCLTTKHFNPIKKSLAKNGPELQRGEGEDVVESPVGPKAWFSGPVSWSPVVGLKSCFYLYIYLFRFSPQFLYQTLIQIVHWFFCICKKFFCRMYT